MTGKQAPHKMTTLESIGMRVFTKPKRQEYEKIQFQDQLSSRRLGFPVFKEHEIACFDDEMHSRELIGVDMDNDCETDDEQIRKSKLALVTQVLETAHELLDQQRMENSFAPRKSRRKRKKRF